MKKILTLILYIITIQNINAQKYTKKYIKEANKIGLEWWGNVNNHEFEAAYNQLADEIKKQKEEKKQSKEQDQAKGAEPAAVKKKKKPKQTGLGAGDQLTAEERMNEFMKSKFNK